MLATPTNNGDHGGGGVVGNNNCSSSIAGGVTIIRVEPHPMPRMPAGVASAGTHRRRNSIPTKRNPKKRHRFRHVIIPNS